VLGAPEELVPRAFFQDPAFREAQHAIADPRGRKSISWVTTIIVIPNSLVRCSTRTITRADAEDVPAQSVGAWTPD
jgi:hypothetical protein